APATAREEDRDAVYDGVRDRRTRDVRLRRLDACPRLAPATPWRERRGPRRAHHRRRGRRIPRRAVLRARSDAPVHVALERRRVLTPAARPERAGALLDGEARKRHHRHSAPRVQETLGIDRAGLLPRDLPVRAVLRA